MMRQRLKRLIDTPIDIGIALIASTIVAVWWFSVPQAERDELVSELGKYIDV